LAELWRAALLLQQACTAATSAFNAIYFSRYSSQRRRHRWGAFALVLVSLALLLQSLFFGILPVLSTPTVGLSPGVEARCTIGLFSLAASLLITAFILRGRRR
jgi:hypothetical protein